MTKPYKNFRLGEEVGFNTYLVRKHLGQGTSGGWACGWISETCLPRKGVYAGYRYKNIGQIRNTEDGAYWETDSTTLCALVLIDPHRNPIPVPFEALYKKESERSS